MPLFSYTAEVTIVAVTLAVCMMIMRLAFLLIARKHTLSYFMKRTVSHQRVHELKHLLNNKRGGLEEHVLEVVLALVCITLLVVGLVRLYTITKESEYEQASAALKRMEQKLQALDAGAFTRFPLESPCVRKKECLWWMRGWSKNEIGRPEKCYFKSCICICKGDEGRLAGASDCQGKETGACLTLEQENVQVGSQAFVLYARRIDTGGNVPVTKPVYQTGEAREACVGIKLAPVLREIELRKEEGRVTVSSVISESLHPTECREKA